MADFKSIFDALRDTKDTTSSYTQTDIDAGRVICAVSYIPFLFWLPLVACNNNPFAKYHSNQALLLTIASVIFSVVSGFANLLPFIGGLISAIFGFATGVVVLIAFVIGALNSLDGTAKELPIIGGTVIIK